MNRLEASAAAALSRRTDKLDPLDESLAGLRDLPGRLSPSDRELLAHARDVPVDVETLDADAFTLLWLVYYKLIDIWVDQGDRVWLRTTRLGEAVARGRSR